LSKIAGRRIDSFKDFNHRGLLSFALLTLGKGPIEPTLQLNVGTPKVDYFVIESPCHTLTPSAPTAAGGYVDRHPLPVGKDVRVDHLLAENVKSASEFRAF
jgi:hypothetical protein